ncbi:hypothetical protein BHS09_30730 [Myxococcus xanthus]|uniref:Uncharacterized protein n=1 Tax=Myxococcus xanthus TaxID=34 RepID=A0AAE6KVB7_MYXXA|nr:hypothetical protein BHS09_30730 [Myxococcus xanthus]QDE78284.1 hypothetical protein BHS08_30750 [Myxococcus xanthus]
MTLHGLGDLSLQAGLERLQVLPGVQGRGGFDDVRGVFAKPATQPPGRLGEDVPGRVHRVTLELGLGQLLPDRGSQARMPVGDDEAHAPQVSLKRLAKQLQPRVHLLAAQYDCQQVSVPILALAKGHQGRDVLRCAPLSLAVTLYPIRVS